jgi:hypothetical protein
LLQIRCAQRGFLQYCTGARPDECHRHRITRTTAGGYDLHGGHAGLRLNNGLDFPGLTKKPPILIASPIRASKMKPRSVR